MIARKKYQALAVAFIARNNCMTKASIAMSKDGSIKYDWGENWESEINAIIDSLPHGSGIDGETSFNFDKSTSEKLIINSSYHFMNESGFYDGWGDFTLIIRKGWEYPEIELKGLSYWPERYRDLREYLSELFHCSLMEDYEFTTWKKVDSGHIKA